MRRLLFIPLFFLIFSVSLAQKEDGLMHVKNLASEKMHGRGYVNNGIHIAENYIDSCFTAYNLQQFDYYDSYKQSVTYSVNTFPDKMNISIDGVKLIPGENFLVDAISAGGSSTLKCQLFNKTDINSIINDNTTELEQKYRNKYSKTCLVFDETDTSFSEKDKTKINQWILFDLLLSNNYNIGAIVKITDKKLTHNVFNTCSNIPYFIVSDKNLASKNPKTITFDVTQKIDTVSTSNICGYIEGKDSTAGIIMLTAHYDHLGQMGNSTTFYGANDNASGIAMLLALAKYYSQNQPQKSIAFVALTGEEIGLIGSKQFVSDPPIDLTDISFLLNIDIAGTGDEGICVVNGNIFTKEINLLKSINNEHAYLSTIATRGESCNSDHCPFYKKNVPCFFIYTLGGIKAYHDIYDKAETLPLTKFNEYFFLLRDFINAL